MTQLEIKKLALIESKRPDAQPPENLCLLNYVYFLGCMYIYRYSQIDDKKARAYMPMLDKFYDTESAIYPNWQKHYESCKATAEHIDELDKLMKACCNNADNCACCKAIKEW